MANKKYVLKFPARLVGRPIASELVSEYGLVVNILRARVEPDEEGMLVVLPELKAGAGLPDYLAYGALSSPGLEAAFHRWTAALERIPQARAVPLRADGRLVAEHGAAGAVGLQPEVIPGPRLGIARPVPGPH